MQKKYQRGIFLLKVPGDGGLIFLIPLGGTSLPSEKRGRKDGIPVFRIIAGGTSANEYIVWS